MAIDIGEVDGDSIPRHGAAQHLAASSRLPVRLAHSDRRLPEHVDAVRIAPLGAQRDIQCRALLHLYLEWHVTAEDMVGDARRGLHAARRSSGLPCGAGGVFSGPSTLKKRPA